MTATNGVSLMSCLSEIDDPRKHSNGTRHDFQEILVISIAAMLSDSDSVEDFAFWGRKKEAWLRRFLVLKNGVPSEETFLRIFRVIDPKQFEAVFRRWVGGVVGALGGTLAVDGKTVRGSGSAGESAIHMVSAFATDLGVVLGQEKVASKSNEITAIPELLDALYIKGLLVSIDAMGCQKSIARQITAQRGDYLLAVKGNQPTLLEAIETSFIDAHEVEGIDRQSQVEKSHGRIVGQIASVLPAQGTVDLTDWPKCKTLGRVDSLRFVGDKESNLERRYYISSRELTAQQLAAAVRAHWGVENRLHWILDVSFGEDGSTVRKDHAPQNLSLLKKIVLNLIRLDTTDKTKASLRLKRKGAAWDDDLRMNMLGLISL
jgi:predicted transposase YbfD/YdcC